MVHCSIQVELIGLSVGGFGHELVMMDETDHRSILPIKTFGFGWSRLGRVTVWGGGGLG